MKTGASFTTDVKHTAEKEDRGKKWENLCCKIFESKQKISNQLRKHLHTLTPNR